MFKVKKRKKKGSGGKRENKKELHKSNTSGFTGVSIRGTGMYTARITHAGIVHNLGSFTSDVGAAMAYDNASKKYRPNDPTKLNFPTNPPLTDVEFNNSMGTLQKSNTSGHTGVSRNGRGNGWKASLFRDKERVHLGTFPTAKKAALAYDHEVTTHNLKRKLNFPNGLKEDDVLYGWTPDRRQILSGRNKTSFTGVYHDSKSGRYSASIRAKPGDGGKKKFLGSFPTGKDAARAFDEAVIQRGGSMLSLNFPNSYLVDGDGKHQTRQHENDEMLDALYADEMLDALYTEQSFIVQSAETPAALHNLLVESEEVSIGSACDVHVIWKDEHGVSTEKWTKAVRDMSQEGKYLYYPAHSLADIRSLDQKLFWLRNDIQMEGPIRPQRNTKKFRDYLNNA